MPSIRIRNIRIFVDSDCVHDSDCMNKLVEKIVNSPSKTFLAFCFCFILGVGSFSFVENKGRLDYYLYVFVFVLLFFIIIFWEKRERRYLLFFALFFVAGGLRLLLAMPAGNPEFISFYNGEKVSFIGVVAEEPAVNIKNVQYVLEAKNLFSPLNKKVSQRVLVRAPLYPEYSYGDILKVDCVLETPRNFIDSNFRYDRYLSAKNIFSVCRNPKISLIEKNSGGGTMAQILSFKKLISQMTERLWAEPESGLVAGILYGRRDGMDENLKENFNRVGLTHIIAVSGYNISILASVIMLALITVGLARPRAFWIAFIGIILFVVFTGASASAVRAGIMGVMVLIAGRLGRLSRLLPALVLSAVLMLIFNPWLLIWDAGFQLSYLAVLGLMYISPILEKFILADKKWTKPAVFILEIFITTMSAIIATLPLILFQFGRLSIVAPLVNVLALWIIPYLMLFGFLAVIFGFIFFPLGQIIAYIAGLGLRYVIIITDWFGGKSWSAVEVAVPWYIMMGMYLVMIWIFFKKKQIKND